MPSTTDEHGSSCGRCSRGLHHGQVRGLGGRCEPTTPSSNYSVPMPRSPRRNAVAAIERAGRDQRPPGRRRGARRRRREGGSGEPQGRAGCADSYSVGSRDLGIVDRRATRRPVARRGSGARTLYPPIACASLLREAPGDRARSCAPVGVHPGLGVKPTPRSKGLSEEMSAAGFSTAPRWRRLRRYDVSCAMMG